MSYVCSDSEVEEVNTPAKAKPQRTTGPRPTPVRPKKVGARAAFEDDSDSDEADFFVVKRSLEEVEHEEVFPEENKSKVLSYLQEADTSYAAGISSGSEDDEGLSGSGGSKRKHSDNDDECAQRQKSRSLSLTPPPMDSPRLRPSTVQKHVPKIGSVTVQAMQTEDYSGQGSDVVVLDSDNEAATPRSKPRAQRSVQRKIASDISDLDPALQAVVHFNDIGSPPRKTRLDTTGGSDTNHLLDKVQIEFKLKFDDTFIMHEVPVIWNQNKWGKVKPYEYTKISKELNKCVAVVAFVSDTVENAVGAFSNEMPVDIMAMDPILMRNRMRVFTTVSIGSLGTKPIHYVDVYPRSVYNRVREKEAVELAAQALEQEQALRDLELARVLRETVVASNALDVGDAGDSGEAPESQDVAVDSIRIKIRDKTGKDVRFQAARTATVQAIIDNYKRMANIDARAQVRLEFDDEGLDPSSRIGDTEIEDDDMITAFWS
ncbi:hypothetical protein IW140_006100 [Coemansia sp. RSA 1813]|nr:hypothetical protein IW140_006100 [Coemansia sp. RSA 1813]